MILYFTGNAVKSNHNSVTIYKIRSSLPARRETANPVTVPVSREDRRSGGRKVRVTGLPITRREAMI